jgi:hypothetical protein
MLFSIAEKKIGKLAEYPKMGYCKKLTRWGAGPILCGSWCDTGGH